MKWMFYTCLFYNFWSQRPEVERENIMKKTELQKKAVYDLLKRIVAVGEGFGIYPNFTVKSSYRNTSIRLVNDGNIIMINARLTGELDYQLTDMLGSTEGRKVYYSYKNDDDHADIIEKFVNDLGRLYKDFILWGGLHGFDTITISSKIDADEALKDWEHWIAEERY